MKFRNTRRDVALDFEIHGVRYQVGIGDTCDIPDEFSYVPKHHGLPLIGERLRGLPLPSVPEGGTLPVFPEDPPPARSRSDAEHGFPTTLEEPKHAEPEEDTGRGRKPKR